MAKQKVSVTVEPDRIARARAIVPTATLSDLIDEALLALIEREEERRWLVAHSDAALPTDLPGEVAVDLSDLPWDDE